MPPAPFNGQKKTPNKTFDTTRDNVCPNLPFMTMNNMKDKGALQGQSGSDCKLIHGDRQQHVEGEMRERFEKSLNTYIKINETWEVHNNLTYTIGGTTDDNRHGVHHQTNWNVRFDHFVHTRTENHDQREIINQPTENVNWFQKIFEFNFEKHSTQIIYFVGNGTKFELDGLEMSWKRYVAQWMTLRFQSKTNDLTWTNVKTDLGGIVNRIKAMRNTAAVTHAEVEPTANAGPTAEDGVHVI